MFRVDLRLGNDDDIFEERGIDPLHIAASKGNVELGKLLFLFLVYLMREFFPLKKASKRCSFLFMHPNSLDTVFKCADDEYFQWPS